MSSGPIRLRRVATAVPLLAALLLAAGCGGGDGEGDSGATEVKALDRDAITKTATGVVVAEDPQEVCGTLLTAQFVATVFTSEKTCRKSATPDPGDVAATGATVTDIKVEGDTASAVVTDQGGQADGATGLWRFARDGAGWRVSEWSVGYLRSGYSILLGEKYKADGAEDPFGDPKLRGCVSTALQALDDAAFLDAAYKLFQEAKEGEELIMRLFLDCAGNSGAEGISTLRKLFEDGVRESSDLPAQVTDCLIENLRAAISDAEIRAMSENTGQNPPAPVQKRIEKATLDCLETTKA